MGIMIKASSIVEGKENQGSIDLAVEAAKQCVASGGIEMEDIGVLINLGMYREDNIAEPAMVTLIQKKFRLNYDPIRKSPADKTTFCFDLLNGSCGFLNAVQIVDALTKNGRIKYALVVSSDVHPSLEQVSEFPYTHCSAAVILAQSSQEGKGFKKIILRTSKNNDYPGVYGYLDLGDAGTEGRKSVVINIDENYSSRLQEFAVTSIKEYIDSENIDLSDVKLIISEPAKNFGKQVAKSIGHDEGLVVEIFEEFRDSHSSALSIGYHLAANNTLKEGDKILFVGATSGLTTACGLYIV